MKTFPERPPIHATSAPPLASVLCIITSFMLH